MAADPLAHPEEAIRRLYGYVAYRIGPGPDAEDIVSETIERALKYRSSYDPRRGTAAAWRAGIENRCIADQMGGRTRQDLYGLDAPEGFVDDLTSRTAVRADLARALATLDDRSRELIALRYGADLSSKEIGRIVDLKPGAVDVAIHRALGRLRGLLEETDQRQVSDELTPGGLRVRPAARYRKKLHGPSVPGGTYESTDCRGTTIVMRPL